MSDYSSPLAMLHGNHSQFGGRIGSPTAQAVDKGAVRLTTCPTHKRTNSGGLNRGSLTEGQEHWQQVHGTSQQE